MSGNWFRTRVELLGGSSPVSVVAARNPWEVGDEMTASRSNTPLPASFFSRRLVLVMLAGTFVYLWQAKEANPFFSDDHQAAMAQDLDTTIGCEEGSPEQVYHYVLLGKHLTTPVYGNVTGYDVCFWLRDPGNPLRPAFRLLPDLKNDWNYRCPDGFSNADHYSGFVGGPFSAARTLFGESLPESLPTLEALLRKHSTRELASLGFVEQEQVLYQALVKDPAGRELCQQLTSYRLIGKQARGYRMLMRITTTPGLVMRWGQENVLWLALGCLAMRCVLARRDRSRVRAAEQAKVRVQSFERAVPLTPLAWVAANAVEPRQQPEMPGKPDSSGIFFPHLAA
jgi:hypothetical protein